MGMWSSPRWTLSRRWWQGDVAVSLLQVAFSLTWREAVGALASSGHLLPAEMLLQAPPCTPVQHSSQLPCSSWPWAGWCPWGELPALPCRWRKDDSFSSPPSLLPLFLHHSPALAPQFWLQEAKQSSAAVVLLYLQVLQRDARHLLPSGSKNIAVAAVRFRSKALIESSGTLLTRIKTKCFIFLLKNCFLLYFAWSAEVGKFISTCAKIMNYWWHQTWISILWGKKSCVILTAFPDNCVLFFILISLSCLIVNTCLFFVNICHSFQCLIFIKNSYSVPGPRDRIPEL